MTITEIAEVIVKEYPDSCVADLGDLSIYEDEDDILVDYLMDFFFFEILDFCGCGVPADTHEVIRRILNIRTLWAEDKLDYEKVQEEYKTDLNIDTSDDIGYGLLQFILYTLDSNGILEHGTSVQGSWLTPLGKMYLTVLNKWRDMQDEG